MATSASIPSNKIDLSWLQRTFETHLPVMALCTIVIPSIVFGMFTMGLNPEDSELRTTYYIVITAAMPVSMLGGFLLAMMPARRVLLIALDAATGVVAFLSYAWFQARISIVPADHASTFPGWQWQSQYQQDVLTALVIVMSLRCGMSFPRRGAMPSADGDTSAAWATACSLIVIASVYFVSWLFGTWWLLHLQVACIAFGSCGVQVLLPRYPSSTDEHPAATGMRNTTWMPILFGFGIPPLMLAQGFTIGVAFVVNSWSASWCAHIGIMILTASLVSCGILSAEKRLAKVMDTAWILITADALLLFLVILLHSRAIVPVAPSWSMASGVSAGLIATALAKLATNHRHPFRATVHLMLALFCTTIGIGGGIAYYLYSGQSISILPGGVSSELLIAFTISGSAIFAAIMIILIIGMRAIIKVRHHEVKASH
ncbi:MAG: hypothetical protein Q6373_018050 [Candidatus Sigynarchaeota archaeon]